MSRVVTTDVARVEVEIDRDVPGGPHVVSLIVHDEEDVEAVVFLDQTQAAAVYHAIGATRIEAAQADAAMGVPPT